MYSWNSQRQQVHAFRQGAAESLREDTFWRQVVVIADGLAVSCAGSLATRIIEDVACRRLWRVRKQKQSGRQEPRTPARSAWTYFAFASAFRLAAQYFFILRLTAFLAAADIFVRLRTGLAPFVFAGRPGPRWGIDGLTALPISRDEMALRMPSS
jgi:hypothetical protein